MAKAQDEERQRRLIRESFGNDARVRALRPSPIFGASLFVIDFDRGARHYRTLGSFGVSFEKVLSGWFGGTITLNGAVSPASSVTFPTDNTNCDFYQWSSQMFLWLTGPAPGVSPWVFDSPIFYSVSPADASGNRTLTQQGTGVQQLASMRAATWW